jgi:hypothetical protein
MLDLFYDRRDGTLTTLTWTLVSVLILGMGLYAFKLDLVAFLHGRQYAGGGSWRTMSNRAPADVGAILALALATGGALGVLAGLCKAFPALAARGWFRWSAALALGLLLLLNLALGALVLAQRLFRG